MGTPESPLEYGVAAFDANVELDDMEIAGASGSAMQIAGRSTVVVRSSHLHDNPGAALIIGEAAAPEILHNLLSSNGSASSQHAAIELRPGARPAFEGNVIRTSGERPIAGLGAQDLARLLKNNAIDAASQVPAPEGAR